ncbi:MAG: hypothetical protein NTW72_07440 [Gemmatimonadetes bacterium]|nr:hypothetical protein [Gemmatimonadota bacterium]
MAVPLDSLPATHGVMVTPYYLMLYMVERRGDVTAVATALLHAERPANNLTAPLDEAGVREPGVAGYVFTPATVGDTGIRRVMVEGDAVLGVRALVAPPEVVALQAAERSQLRSGALLAVLALLFIATAWRREDRLRRRLATLAVVVLALAVLPLGAYSNVSRWFDPGLYYAPTLGPLTANVAALAVVSALVLMALFAVLRRAPRTRSRWMWIVLLVVVPFIAAVSALIAPALLEAPARLPSWYPALWIGAIAALALVRRARRAFWRTAFVAACGAVTLVWAASVRQRVQLAEHDVAGLGGSDPYATSLLQRLAGDLAADAPLPSRAGLLARYASSELGAA